MASEPLAIVPGHSLGFLSLGASLHEVLTAIKADKEQFPTIDLHISQHRPLAVPIVVGLPQNGIRLRFDACDQRLRLIEVLDFGKVRIAYKGSELVKKQEGKAASFKRIYQLFGASYPGEYIPPKTGHTGTYVLSWTGIAFNFPLQHQAYSPDKDHVSLLGSHAASSASNMAIFDGNSWPEARPSLFTKVPSGPRLPALISQPRDNLPAEIEEASIVEMPGQIVLHRRTPAVPFTIILGQTTPQDLLTELGQPDATHKRESQPAAEDTSRGRPRTNSRSLSNGHHRPTPPSSYSSTGTDTFDTDFESGDTDDDPAERAGRETFWCYFSHGMDILVGPFNDQVTTADLGQPVTPLSASPHLVVLKVVMHGNVPGSYSFNRHRRLRWSIQLPGASATLISEHSFEDIKPDLLQAFHGVWPETEMGRGKVVNRTWGAGPSDSSFFLPDTEHDLVEAGGSEQWLGNTKLYSFPGLQFEVLQNGAISALTVS